MNTKGKEKLQLEWSGGIAVIIDPYDYAEARKAYNHLFETDPSKPNYISFEDYQKLRDDFFKARDNATEFDSIPYETITSIDEYLDFNKYNPPSIDFLSEKTKRNLIESMNEFSPKRLRQRRLGQRDDYEAGTDLSSSYRRLFDNSIDTTVDMTKYSAVKLVPMVQVKANGVPVPFSKIPEKAMEQITNDILNQKHSGKLETYKMDVLFEKDEGDGLTWTLESSDRPGLYFVEIQQNGEVVATDTVKGPLNLTSEKENKDGINIVKTPTPNEQLKNFVDYLYRNHVVYFAVDNDMTIKDYQKSLQSIDLEKYKDTEKIKVKVSFEIPSSPEYVGTLSQDVNYILTKDAPHLLKEGIRSEGYIERILDSEGAMDLGPTDLTESAKRQIKLNVLNNPKRTHYRDSYTGKKWIGFAGGIDKGECLVKVEMPLDFSNNKEVISRALDSYLNNETAKFCIPEVVEVDVSDLIEREYSKFTKNIPITEIIDCGDSIEGYFVFDNKEYGFDFDIASQEITLHNYDPDSYDSVKNEYTRELPLPRMFTFASVEDAVKDEIDIACTNYLLEDRGKEELDKIIASAEEKRTGIKNPEITSKDEVEL